MTFVNPFQREDDLRARLADLKSEPGATLEALYAAQDVFSYVPPEAVTMIAEELRLPESEVFGVLTFSPRSRGTPCFTASPRPSTCFGSAGT